MSATSQAVARPAGMTWNATSLRRASVTLFAVAVVVGAVLLGRAQLVGHHASSTVLGPTVQVGAIPTSPQIEQTWGIRVVDVITLADGGLIELRYQVVDPSRGSRIHVGGSETASLPVLRDETRGKVLTAKSAMFHFHHGQTAVNGRTYSILYGNSGGVIHVGDLITIRMSDGLQLRHVRVVT
jgi:hypothetical protein